MQLIGDPLHHPPAAGFPHYRDAYGGWGDLRARLTFGRLHVVELSPVAW